VLTTFSGFYVIATARNTASLKDLTDLGVSAVSLEVTSEESIEACKKEVASICNGKLDILVNNA
jgi:1-acylglycerone phosphate reductase